MTEPQTPSTTTPKKRGCFFYGCLTLVILTVVLGVTAFFAVRYTLGKMNAFVDQFTDTRPAALPKATMDKAAYDELEKRVAAFKDALDGRQAGAALTLTAQDLNGLIANSPALQQWKDQLYVTIDGDQVKGEVSLPLGQMANLPGMSHLQGRYLNGSAALKVALSGGLLDVRLLTLDVKGAPLPEQFLAGMRGQNLAKDATRDPKTAEALQRLESLEIKDGAVTLKARAPGDQAEAPR
jgi:hypothetical protein